MQNSKIMTRKSAIIIVALIVIGFTTSVLEAARKADSLKTTNDVKSSQTKVMSSPSIGLALFIRSLPLSDSATH